MKPVLLQVADAELCLYLCNKYNLPSNIKNKMKTIRFSSLMRLAFHTRNAELADEVRRKKKILTWKEWLQYHGAKFPAFYYVYRTAALFHNLFLKNKDWL